MNKKCVVVDGNALLYRSYYGTIKFIDYYKQHNLPIVNGVYAMTRVIKNIMKHNYDYWFVTFDHKKKNFRHDLLPDYKANRKTTPMELIRQIPIAQEFLNALGIYFLSMENFEGDDLIGSYCQLFSSRNCSIDVYSCDHDLLQLVDQNVTVKLFKKSINECEEYNNQNFCEKLNGLSPCQIPDLKGIVGDKSDNLPGVKGVGDKTAYRLLKQWKTLDNIYQNIDALSQKEKEKFLASKQLALLSKKLAIIQTDLLKDEDPAIFCRSQLNYDKFQLLTQEYSLLSLLKDL